MAIIEPQSKKIRTGLGSNIKTIKSAQAKGFKNPVLNAQIGSGFRATQVTTKPPFDLEALRNAYLVDSYIRQGIDKYIEIMLKEGYYLDGKKRPKEYLEGKLMEIAQATNIPWAVTVENTVRDFIKYGNAFLVVVRNSDGTIGGYFNLPAHQMFPELDEDGNILNWVQVASRDRKKSFNPKDILHFTYAKESGGIWGIPYIVSVIEDIRALRQAEESVLKLIYKSLSPLIHVEVPNITGTGEGRQEDIDDAVRQFQTAAPDGILVTPPGHKISAIGVESQALRAEGYLKMFKNRVFSGLAVSPLIMGENAGAPGGTADALVVELHHKAKRFQVALSQYFEFYIFNPLLVEGGFDPWGQADHRVSLVWNEIELDRRIKEEAHILNLWTGGILTFAEARDMLKLDPNVSSDDTYVHHSSIPQVIASRLGIDPKNLSEDELKDLATGGMGGPSFKGGSTKEPKVSKLPQNIVSPSNKTTGPNARVKVPVSNSADEELRNKLIGLVSAGCDRKLLESQIDDPELVELIDSWQKDFGTLETMLRINAYFSIKSKIGVQNEMDHGD